MPRFRFLRDRDPWMLGEEIPDMDFFFSQIWLSGFENEFRRTTGRAFKKVLALCRGYHLWFYYGENDSRAVAEHLVARMFRAPSFATRINREILKSSDTLRGFAETLPKDSHRSDLSNRQLWLLCARHDRLHTQYYEWGWIPVAADMFHNTLTNRLKRSLEESGVPRERVNEYFVVLTQPTKRSLIQIEREEFLRIAARVQAHPVARQAVRRYRRRLDGIRSTRTNHERRLEKIVAPLAADLPVSLRRAIQRHYERYFYVNHLWVAPVSTFDHYLLELVRLLEHDARPSQTLRAEQKKFRAGIVARRRLFAKLKLPRNLRTIFGAFGDFMVTKIYRRYAQIYALYRLEFVQREIARRLRLSLQQVRFMLPEELRSALLRGTVRRRTLTQRTRFCAYYAERDRHQVFTGTWARALAAAAHSHEAQLTDNLHGQTGCPGKAVGAVRIVIRPTDMHKMRKGDILVSIATDPDIVPAMKKAAAIVTEQGGVTSHAAIVSRELGIPCVIGTKVATRVLKDGDRVEVNATKGIVRKV